MNKKRMNAMLGSVTALCIACTTMSNAIVFAKKTEFATFEESDQSEYAEIYKTAEKEHVSLGVSNTEELNSVLTKVADGVETTIYIENSFELQEKITIREKKINFVGRNNGVTISAGTNLSEKNMFLFYNSEITFENIILNGNAISSLYSSNLENEEYDGCTVTLNNRAVLTNGKTVNNRKSTLIMNDGSEISNCTGAQGGAINLWPNGVFIMNGGELKNNKANNNGGAVDANVNAKVIINGGTISGNSNRPNHVGGAISVRNGSTLEIHGGLITNNTSGYGDVIGIIGNNTVKMTGGEISDNKHAHTTNVTNPLYIGELSGGKILNNECSIRVNNISGSPVVKGNFSINNKPTGLHGGNQAVEINGALAEGAYIETVFNYNSAWTPNNLEYFKGSNYEIKDSDLKKLHCLASSTNANGISIVPYFENGVIKGRKMYLNEGSGFETINMDGQIPSPIRKGYRFEGWYEDAGFNQGPITDLDSSKEYYAKWIEKEESSIKFKNDLNFDKTYDGNPISISENDYTLTEGAGNVRYCYQVKNEETWVDIEGEAIQVGAYRVKAVVTENDTHKEAETDWIEFNISKAIPTYTLPNDLVVRKGNALSTVKLPNGFTWVDGTKTADELGTHEFDAIYTPEDVINYETVNVKISVEVIADTSTSGGATVKLNPVYRAYNPNNGEHLYTLDEKEYKHVATIGWDAEGVAFMAEEEKNGQALYRVYNPNSGLHHYTLDENEKNTLVSLGWHDEKVAWYTSKKPQSAPVYRVYNPNDGNHHYTMNKQEKDVLVSLGWQDEGLAFRTAPIEK